MLGKRENKLLNLLTDFYKNGRYNYLDENFKDYRWSINKLNDYLKNDNLPGLEIFGIQYFFPKTSKRAVMKSVSIIIDTYIKLLKKISDERGLYILETQTNFKLSVFYFSSVNDRNLFDYFEMVDISKYEIYYFFLKETLENVDEDLLARFPPLELDPALIPDYLSEQTLFKVKWDMVSTVEDCYSDLYEGNTLEIERRKSFMQNLLNDISSIL